MNFNKMNVSELSVEETVAIDGGLFGLDDLLLTVVAGAALAIIDDWDNFKAGLAGGQPIQ